MTLRTSSEAAAFSLRSPPALGALAAVLVLTACNGGVTEPPFLAETVTPVSPTVPEMATPTFVVTGIPASMGINDAVFDEFRVFTRQIDNAARTDDSRFFANRGIEYLTVCQERDTSLECTGQPVGTRLEGIYAFNSQTGDVLLMSRDAFATMLDDWWATALHEKSDDYGSGEPRVEGIARWDGNEALAVVSLIAETDHSVTQRQARIFRFIQIADGVWALHVERFLPTYDLVARWLSGTCAECYDYWERWEDSP